jgi:hypothetical protein
MYIGQVSWGGCFCSEIHTNPLIGINFPAYAFENQAETEGFAKMAKRAGYEDTEEKPGNA